MNLTGKTAVITGAASGIGAGLARACLDEAMNVVVSDADGARLSETAGALRAGGGTVADHTCDVRDRAQVEDLRDIALHRFGRVDLVCNNAGIGLARPAVDCGDADWQLLFDVNVNGVVNGLRTFLPVMIEQGAGHLNATASLSGLVGDPGLMIYNGTKFAVVGMMESLAIEMQRDHPGVSCSVLCPGPVATDLMATSGKQLADAGSEPAGATEHTAEIAAYLASGLHPDEVGAMAMAGIEAGHFWLLPHAELTWELMDPRYAAMKHRRLHADKNWIQPR